MIVTTFLFLQPLTCHQYSSCDNLFLSPSHHWNHYNNYDNLSQGGEGGLTIFVGFFLQIES